MRGTSPRVAWHKLKRRVEIRDRLVELMHPHIEEGPSKMGVLGQGGRKVGPVPGSR